MEKMKWWQGGDWFERNKINEAVGEINIAARSVAEVDEKTGRLFELDRAQGEEIAKLKVTVWELIQLLVEKKVMTEQEVSDRLRERLQSVLEPSKPAPVAASGKEQRRDTTCRDCGEKVQVRNTYLTERGPVCDDCYRKSQLKS